MITVPHRAIRASAGSGKTFQLAHRYVQLLALGVAGERITALTFSRKAAGEIFDAIATLLCKAAGSEDDARKTSGIIQLPHLAPSDYLLLLRKLIDSMPRLHIGTLDSFTVNILKSFPMELGLSGDLSLLDEDGVDAKQIRDEILRRLFNHRLFKAREQHDFHEAYKQATFGREQKGVQQTLTDFVSRYHRRYQELPIAEGWGDPLMIWDGPCPFSADITAARNAAARLQAWLPEQQFSARAATRWRLFIDRAANHDRHTPWPTDGFKLIFERLVEVTEDLRRGNAEITIDRCRCPIKGAVCADVLALLEHTMGVELLNSIENTAGLFRVLQRYEQLYDRFSRRRGRMTFADAQMLLAGRHIDGTSYKLSCTEAAPDRLYIDYRLDARLDHWLLDEFQDTSDLQWEVLENLIDEVLSDNTGRRTLFYVGDIKQAIYGWRGGNAHLFTDLIARYKEGIEECTLQKSFRSCPAVIETVNAVFSNLPREEFPEQVISRWEEDWRPHASARQNLSGCTMVIEPPPGEDGEKPAALDRYRLAAALLKEINPLERGLTAAILVRTNDQGVAVADALRRYAPGLPAAFEGSSLLSDNMVVNLMLALVRVALHPGDTLSWGHLAMSPLYPALLQMGITRDNCSVILLAEIRRHGARIFIRRWGQRLQEAATLDQFGLRRLRDLEDAATVFDLREVPEAALLLPVIENASMRESSGDNTVRVMTIHQSKGLGFDIVILPELQSSSIITANTDGLLISRDPTTRLPNWMLKQPPKIVAAQDAVLSKALDAAADEKCFEQLCLLYVAMTRAKRGMYIISSYPGKTAKAFTPAALIKQQLTGDPKPSGAEQRLLHGEPVEVLHERGDILWHESVRGTEKGEEKPLTALSTDYARRPATRNRPERVRPSEPEDEAGKKDVEQALDPGIIAARRFGQALHELFEQVHWLDETDPADVALRWRERTRLPDPLAEGIRRRFMAVMNDPTAATIFRRPAGAVELWREKRFEIILDNRWISGVFDRVILTRDGGNAITGAEIIDFKSDRIADEIALAAAVARHRPQMEDYRRVLARLTGIPESVVVLRLLFTHASRVIDL